MNQQQLRKYDIISIGSDYMEKFYLEVPSIERKEEALDYLNEHIKYKSEMNCTGSMDRCLNKWTYEQWLDELKKKQNQEYMDSIGWAPSLTYFLIRENDNKIIGMINLRYNITKEILAKGCSHIGYGIRPTERRKGYNKINLYLGLLEEQRLGEKKVLLECIADNQGSNKTIIALGGILEKSEIDDWDNELTNYYWIDVDKSIEEYRSNYIQFISKKIK